MVQEAGRVKFGIGQPLKRFEDQKLLTGQGRYTDDIAMPGMAHGVFLRAQVAHAHIRGIDTATARAMPGVLIVLTGEDVVADGIKDIPCNIPLVNRDGTPRRDTPRPILAVGKVRHVGQTVAIVVAETLDQARDAAEAILVDYDELPSVVDARAATEPGAPQLFDGVPNNLVFDWDNDQGDAAATAAAFAQAAHVTRIDIVNNRIVANSMEARNALADYDKETGRTTLYTTSQGPHMVRNPLLNVLGLAPEQLRVVTPHVGGGFGMKAFLYPEQAAIVWASRKVKRPVKWQAERSEGFLADAQGRAHHSHAELAMDEDGKFLGIRVVTYAELGAYLSPFGPFIPTRSTDLIPGLYATPAIHITVKGVCTNTMTVCAYRGAGRPEAAYLMERLVDAAARDLGLSQDEIRRRNFIPAEAMPFKTATRLVYDSGDFTGIMERCMVTADWSGFAARRAASEARGRLRGIGMATYTERCGGGGSDTVAIEFKDGRIEILMGNQEFGTGLHTAYRQLLGDRLGIDPERIEVIMGDTDRTPPGMTGGSRALPVGGSALAMASQDVIEKGRSIAAHLLEAAVADVGYEDGNFIVPGTDLGVDLFTVAAIARDPAKLPPGMEPGLDITRSFQTDGPTFPNGCHIAEVDIDPDTGVVTIDRYTVVDDFGRTINPLMLEGQVHGGIVQGIGQALFEETVYDEQSGQLITGSFTDYALPRADTVPFFAFETRNVPCKNNPLGVKGAGEAGSIGAPPCLINAIVDALYTKAGIRNIDMPATPRKVWEALQRAAG
jgi:carbon-monoxide dehydrogenase large subunit